MTDYNIYNPFSPEFYWAPEGYCALPPLIIPDKSFYLIGFAFALFFTAYRIAAVKFIWRPLGNWCDIQNSGVLQKFTESAFRASYYGPIWCVAAYYGWFEAWTWNSRVIFDDMYTLSTDDMTAPFRWIYYIQFGWYVHCTYAHLVLDTRKKDFTEMLIHHVLTLSLINSSLAAGFGYFRIGIFIFISLDLCDVFLEGAKVLRYAGHVALAYVSFGFLLVSWIFFRLFWYIDMVWNCQQTMGPHDTPYYFFYWVTLWGLAGLQVFWFFLIVRVIIRAITTGEADDVREPADFTPDRKKKTGSKNKKKNT
eukprot:TRINITY_DN6163_c0_g2_i1.p1 TRINITY_DN6163_c0_g2~~TRINITY_DN6163_c0_g2_i1.p1  ORF type:complete len:308 (-),score=66.04 TRINITY_DN6163_c0_g2_i1:39-962(-)